MNTYQYLRLRCFFCFFLSFFRSVCFFLLLLHHFSLLVSFPTFHLCQIVLNSFCCCFSVSCLATPFNIGVIDIPLSVATFNQPETPINSMELDKLKYSNSSFNSYQISLFFNQNVNDIINRNKRH